MSDGSMNDGDQSGPAILAFAGSLREGSFNKQLLNTAVDGARAAGGDVTLIDLRDYPMPPYDGDLESESGLPKGAIELKDMFAQHAALLIATPEYNNGIPGTLKNVLDWVSRKGPGESGPVQSYKGKVAAVISASPGPYGGARALAQLRVVLLAMGVIVLPEGRSIVRAGDAFDEHGQLKDKDVTRQVRQVGARLAEVTKALAGG